MIAQNKLNNTKSFAEKATCNDLITEFNKGEHIIDDNNNKNSYAILNCS